MTFIQKKCTRSVVVHPANITKNMKSYLKSQLKLLYNNTLSDDGYIQNIEEIIDVSYGEINSCNDGYIHYEVTFIGYLYVLKVHMIKKCVIDKITPFGIYANDFESPTGLCVFFVPKPNLDKNKDYNDVTNFELKIEALRTSDEQYLCVCSLIDSY